MIASSVLMLFRGGAALSSVRVEKTSTNALQDFDTDMFANKSEPLLKFTTGARGGDKDKLVSIDCPSGKTVTFPHDAILLERGPKRILWCPNAKVGTSTIYTTFAHLLGEHPSSPGEARSDGQQTSILNLLQEGHMNKLCTGITFSFTVIRNPWDRIRSAYLDKINRVIFVPGHGDASFNQFLMAISKTDPATMNAHWQPISHRCVTTGPNRFHYSKVYKLEEHFEESLEEVFTHLDIAKSRTRAAIEKIGRKNVGNSDHTLESRWEAYSDPVTRKVIPEIYHDDIEFGRYKFTS